MPPQALATLQSLLEKASLICTSSGFFLDYDHEALLQAGITDAGGYIAADGTSAPLALPPAASASPLQTAQALGVLLQSWEKEQTREIDLNEAGVCRRQLVYALTGEEWLSVWDGVLPLLCSLSPAAEALGALEIHGKGTFKRYFDRSGQEIGAYFYAEQCRLDGSTCEVRLEYALQPEKGFYLAFRCPNPAQTVNFRVALHGKYNGGAYRITGDIRRIDENSSDVLTLSGNSKSLTAELSRKTDDGAIQYALTLEEAGEHSLAYAYRREGLLMLSGGVTWTQEEAALPVPAAPNGDTNAVAAALSLRMARILRNMDPAGVQELLHCIGAAQYLRDSAASLSIQYDPAYAVTKEGN